MMLRIVPPEISRLPWEFLYNADRSEYFCRLNNTPVVRYVEVDDPVAPIAVRPPLRILSRDDQEVRLRSYGVELEVLA